MTSHVVVLRCYCYVRLLTAILLESAASVSSNLDSRHVCFIWLSVITDLPTASVVVYV